MNIKEQLICTKLQDNGAFQTWLLKGYTKLQYTDFACVHILLSKNDVKSILYIFSANFCLILILLNSNWWHLGPVISYEPKICAPNLHHL